MSVLDQLPVVSDKRMAVRVTPDARRQIAAGHPWVFNESITSISHRGAVGDLAVIFDNDRNFVAIGLWDPGSPIRIRSPASRQAGHDRLGVLAPADHRGHRTTFGDRQRHRRLPGLNGENDGFPGLVLDRYADTFVVKLYSPTWIPHLRSLVAVIDELFAPIGVGAAPGADAWPSRGCTA